MIQRLRLRLTVVCAAVTAIILVIMAVCSVIIVRKHIARREETTFCSDVNTVTYYIQSQSSSGLVLIDHQWFSKTEKNNGLIISIEENGKSLLFQGAEEHETRQELVAQVKQKGKEEYQFTFEKMPSSTVEVDSVYFTLKSSSFGEEREYWANLSTVPVEENRWLGISVVKSMEESQREIENLMAAFFFFGMAAVVGLVVFAWFFTGWSIRPIVENQRRQIQFISAVSHELRSPLAVIQSSISAVLTADKEVAAHFANNITEECCRMSRLIEDMLTLSSADSRTWSIQKEETDLETLLLTVSDNFEPMARSKGISLTVSLPEQVLAKCLCDKQRIVQVLSILVDNAICYTPKGGKVELEARENRNSVELIVADNGPGIPCEEQKRIFDRFYRRDSSRTEKNHYGLGLSVAKEIMALHKGSLTVTDTPGGGATFHVFLNIK